MQKVGNKNGQLNENRDGNWDKIGMRLERGIVTGIGKVLRLGLEAGIGIRIEMVIKDTDGNKTEQRLRGQLVNSNDNNKGKTGTSQQWLSYFFSTQLISDHACRP